VSAVRVAFVSSHAGLGGSERYLERLMAGLGDQWFSSVVVLDEGDFVARLQRSGYEPRVLPTSAKLLSMLWSAWRLRRLIAETRPQLVHANGVKAALISVLATAGTRSAVLWLKHDLSWDGRLGRAIARRCRIVVGVSSAVIEPLGSPSVSRVVLTGVPVSRIDASTAREHALALAGDGASAVVCLVGRLHPMKGHREVLAILPRLLREIPGLRVAFAGPEDSATPGYRDELRKEAESGGVDASVRFLGYREDVSALLAGSDAVVVPSLPDDRGMGREGFGLVAVEAMAVGTPVVAYADGALPEVVGDCGLLVPAGDRSALAEALLRVLRDGPLREDLAQRGRERVAERYGEEAWVEAIQGAYREALTRAR